MNARFLRPRFSVGAAATWSRRVLLSGAIGLGILAAMTGLPSGMAHASTVMTISADTPWIVAARQPEALQRAIDDLRGDWYKVFEHTPVVLTEPPADWSGPAIYLGLGGAWREAFDTEPFPGAESFRLQLRRDSIGRTALVAFGGDLRGSIYAVYALAEEILGVDPWYFWTDNVPQRRSSIEVPEDFNEGFGPPTFRYRGWFINDEDLLSGFSPDPLRENVFSLAIADRIFETLLRLRGNLVVPATWAFPDERLNELASRRGLILGFHHIQVAGLSTFRWPNDVPFSFQRHPEIMEEYWRTCIDFLKDRDVVWTVGYRGRSDKPFWQYEEGLDTDEARGRAISAAIERQVELIREVQPEAPIVSNLWREGAELWNGGHIRLPEGVTAVWADCGQGLMQDGGRVEPGQGIYYHTAMWNTTSNQLSELVNPERIYREIGRFIRAGATEYFLVNVSDVRPVPLSTDCVMKLIWDAAPYLERGDKESMASFLVDWARRQYGMEAAEEAATLYADYFNIPYQRQHPRPYGDRWAHYNLQRMHDQSLSAIREGEPLPGQVWERLAEVRAVVDLNHDYLRELVTRVEAFAPSIPEARRAFYQSHLVAQTRMHLLSLDMLHAFGLALDAYAAGERPRAAEQVEAALRAVEEVAELLHAGEYGKWSGWYQGELFVGFYASRDRLRVLSAALRGEEIPPTRRRLSPRSMFFYQRQPEFRGNYPLFYPAAREVDR